jgi:hypothetical protein
MKRKSSFVFCLLAVCLTASCSSLSGVDFNFDTTSPQKTYRVKVEGRGQSFTSTVQQVKLTVFKGNETVVVDDKFYREEVDHLFSREFPVHEWMSESVLRFGKQTAAQTSADKVVVVNNDRDRLAVLKVEYSSLGEKFLIFDFAPGAKLELTVLPYSSSREFPNPNISYTVYANGQSFETIVGGWGKTSTGSEILVEVKKSPAEAKSTRLTEFDLARIGALAPKGRVQDKDYNRLPVVEVLIAHGKESIPYLISKLDDETKIGGHIVDYWYDVRVGDVALIILTDFFTDPTWQNTTIPGVGWDKFLERGTNTDLTAEQVLRNYISKHGRSKINARWQKLWEEHRDKVQWDEKERCFKRAS